MFDLSIYNDKSTLSRLFDIFYKEVNKNDIFLYSFDKDNNNQTLTYKELNAKAHCLAAYFIKIGIKKSNKILIIAQNNLNCYIVDLACNLIGIQSLSLPFDIKEQNFNDIFFHFKPDLCFIEGYEVLKKYKSTLYEKNFKNNNILLFEQHPQNISEYEKNTILIEIAIEIGKTYWRENQNLINEIKNSVQESDILFYLNQENFITHKEFISNLKKIISNYPINPKIKQTNLLIHSLPYHLLAKYSFYLGLFRYFNIYINQNEFLHQFILKNKIHHWVTSGKFLNHLSNQWFNTPQRRLRSFAIQKKKDKLKYKFENKNLPFGLKIQSNILGFQRKLIQWELRTLNTIHVLDNEIILDDILYWNAINIPILSYQIDWNGNVINQSLINFNKSIYLLKSKNNFSLYSENFFNESLED